MAELIKVTFPDGKEICYKYPVYTVIEVLRKIGVERFSEISLQIRRRPLVSQEIFPELKNYTKEIIPSWYYITQSDTREKTSQLININRELNLNLKIEVGSEFKGTSRPRIEGRKRPKNRLIVTLPNGEVLDYGSYRDVFTACIDKLGPYRVSRVANIDLARDRPLITTTNPDGNRLRIEEHMYLALPYTALATKRTLDLIGRRLGVDLKTVLIPLNNNINE